MPRTDADATVRDIIYVAPSQIVLDPKFLAREKPVDDIAVTRMATSMRRFGQLQPIRAIHAVGDDGEKHLYAIFGATRTRAGCLIEESNPSFRLQVQVAKNLNEEDAFVMSIEENRRRNKTTPIDDGLNARRLMGYGWTKDRIAELYDLESTQAVDNLLSLLSLPTPLRDRVRDGSLPAAAALEHLVGLPDAEAVAIVQDAEAKVLEARATIPFDDSIPPASEALPEAYNPDIASEPAAAPETVKPKKTKAPKLGKNGQPRVTSRQVAASKRERGGTAKRTWSDFRAVIVERGDVMSRAIMEFLAGDIDDRELDRVFDEAAAAMNASDRKPKAKAAARQPIRQLNHAT